MDLISHALWAGAAAEALHRRGRFSRRDVAGAVALGAMPDLVGALPVLAASVGGPAPLKTLLAYAMAVPGTEPALQAGWAYALEHHLHCSAHSVIVLAIVTALALRWARAAAPSLLGWWLHLALDVPTHSDDYYAVTIFYPFTEWSFDGIAWTNPIVLGTNYVLLAVAYAWLWRTSRARP